MVVSADLDGLVSAAMLASVCPDWTIAAFVVHSAKILIYPTLASAMPRPGGGGPLLTQSRQHQQPRREVRKQEAATARPLLRMAGVGRVRRCRRVRPGEDEGDLDLSGLSDERDRRLVGTAAREGQAGPGRRCGTPTTAVAR